MGRIIDANILLYAVNRGAREHPQALNFVLESAKSSDQWYLTEGVIYEFLRVSTHPRVFPLPLTSSQALLFMKPFVQSSAFRVLGVTDDHWDLLEREIEGVSYPAGNLFFDIRTVVLMREHGIRTIYTADKDFLQFADITVIDPVHTI
jgi:toxin-antitoxin system PIN domain toxin